MDIDKHTDSYGNVITDGYVITNGRTRRYWRERQDAIYYFWQEVGSQRITAKVFELSHQRVEQILRSVRKRYDFPVS